MMTQKKNGEGKADERSGEEPDPLMAELKQMYDSVAEEPLPQELLTLLDKLDKAERSR